ncbi:MAG TPA: AraC family transcriptional regulator [Candidatus Anaerofilum faecale]|nr:AraC family transcriptional regulator [Candidatus Anaerofilum faecale]
MSSYRFDFITAPTSDKPYQLLYVASSCYDKDWNSLMHTHKCTELFYCVHGRGQFHTSDGTFDVKKDDLVIINADVEHAESSMASHPLEYLVLGVQGLNFRFDSARGDAGYDVLNFEQNRDELLFYLQSILREVDTQEFRYEDMCQRILEILLIQVQRFANVKICTSLPAAEKQHSTNRNCALIRQYIDEHFSEPITLDTLAQMVHINKYHLVRTFQKEYGITPINYLIERRLEESRFMLKNTNYSASQIVSLLGFSSSSYFSQCFRRKEHMSPSQYREMYAHKED